MPTRAGRRGGMSSWFCRCPSNYWRFPPNTRNRNSRRRGPEIPARGFDDVPRGGCESCARGFDEVARGGCESCARGFDDVPRGGCESCARGFDDVPRGGCESCARGFDDVPRVWPSLIAHVVRVLALAVAILTITVTIPCVGQGHPDIAVAIRFAARQTETDGRDAMALLEVAFVPAAGQSGTAVAAGML